MRYGKFYELKVRMRSRGAVGQFIGVKNMPVANIGRQSYPVKYFRK